MSIDYKKILIWYINFVMEMEGTHFLSQGHISFSSLTEEENKALEECRDIAEGTI